MTSMSTALAHKIVPVIPRLIAALRREAPSGLEAPSTQQIRPSAIPAKPVRAPAPQDVPTHALGPSTASGVNAARKATMIATISEIGASTIDLTPKAVDATVG